MFNAFHPKKAAEGVARNRFELATGKDFEGQQLILGQLVYARKDRISRHKFEAAASPALFAGWRFDSGPKSYKGVCYVLDYESIKQQTPGYQIALAIPLEEVYVPDGPPILPLKAAADRALTLFSEPLPEDIQPIEVPFSELPRDARAGERHEYITLDRIIKYGPSPACRACENVKGKHTPACRARFDGLIKADKIDASKSSTKARSIAPSTLAPETPGFIAEPELADVEPETEAARHPDELPFSAGIPPGETDGRALAARGGAQLLWDDAFLQQNKDQNMTRRCTTLKGRNVLFEYACSDDSVIGRVAAENNVKCIRLGKSTLDLCNPDHVSQALEQADVLPGSDAWISIDCTQYSPIQNLNVHIHGKPYQRKLEERRAQTRIMLAYAIQFAMNIMCNHGRIVFGLPKDSGIWKLDEWKQFAEAYGLKRVVFDGCALGLVGTSGAPLRKPWCLFTNDIRIIQFFSQFVCPGNHTHEETMGKNAKLSAFYTKELANVLIECWYPQLWYRSVPALVTLNLPRSTWLNDPKGVDAVQREAQGLRRNGTWDDSTVQLVSTLKSRARQQGIQIKLAELLTLCGIKHSELPPENWKWKGRICYRGDIVRDAWNNIQIFEETATTPTSLIALGVALWFASLPGHSASCADALQAFLQSVLDDSDEETWVVLPAELRLESWFKMFNKTDRICVKLKRSLYGHPKAGRWWQDHLHRCLQALGAEEIPQYPSNYLIPWEQDGKQ